MASVNNSLCKQFAVPIESLNTGLCMRKTGETSYGRQRRFILANPGIQTSRKGGILESDIGRVERRFCERYGIPYIEPVGGFGEVLSIRACDRCFQSGHHSKYFACEWLTRCPVHGRMLSTLCSGCRSAWPTGSEMLKRNCKVCGRVAALTGFAFGNASDTKSFDDKIAPLIELENIYVSLRFLDFYSSCGPYGASNWHQSMSLFAHRLPGMLSCFCPRAKELFRVLGIRKTEHAKIFFFDRKEQLSSSEWSRKANMACEKTFKEVSKGIKKKCTGAGKLINPQDIISGMTELTESSNFRLLAYSIWVNYADPKIRPTSKQKVLGMRSDEPLFLIPAPMTVCGPKRESFMSVIDAKYSYADPWADSESYVYPPLDLMGFIYQMDLKACYKRIYQYLRHQACVDTKFPERGKRSRCYGGNILIRFDRELQTYEISVPTSANCKHPRVWPTVP